MTSGRGISMADQARIIAEVFARNKQSACVLIESVSPERRSLTFSMEKAKRDFGFEPAYASFRDLMTDLKKDLDANIYKELFHY